MLLCISQGTAGSTHTPRAPSVTIFHTRYSHFCPNSPRSFSLQTLWTSALGSFRNGTTLDVKTKNTPLSSSTHAVTWHPPPKLWVLKRWRGTRAPSHMQQVAEPPTSEQPKRLPSLWGHGVCRLVTTHPMALHCCHWGHLLSWRVREPSFALLHTKATHSRAKGIIVFLAISVKSLKSNSRQGQAVICVHREPGTKALFVLRFLYLQEDPELNIMRESSKGFVLSCRAV